MRALTLLFATLVMPLAALAQSAASGQHVQVLLVTDNGHAAIAEYAKRVAALVGERWTPETGPHGQPEITFTVGPQGAILRMLLTRVSGSVRIDRNAWSAISGATFPALPSGEDTSAELRAEFLP